VRIEFSRRRLDGVVCKYGAEYFVVRGIEGTLVNIYFWISTPHLQLGEVKVS
jgi:hypothetical protein